MRASGVLMPVFSLPSRYGIGCFSKEAYEFVDRLSWAGQARWQVLPLGPTGYGDSPYQPFSTFAGNPYFIDLEALVEEGLLTSQECDSCQWGEDPRFVDYGKIYESRYPLLRKAFARFEADDDYREFCRHEAYWMDDYCLFRALKDSQGGKPWMEWDDELRTRDAAAIREAKEELAEEIEFFRFIQYKFQQQWKKLKSYAHKKGIRIIGDLPIYVASDSADAWANPRLFQFDEDHRPKAIAGCPPDAFSATGQMWGNPLYDWEYHEKTGYAWWIERMKKSFELYDTVRVDHFRAFAEYYSIPCDAENASAGKWVEGPGMKLFDALEKALGPMDLIAEDLGTLDDKVFDLLDAAGYPGMKVLQFAFDSGNTNFYLPHHYKRNCVVYTGTHDNDTTKAWYYSMNDWAREYSKAYLNNYDRPWEDISWDFIRAAHASVADLSVIPMQDLLCAGSEGRINHPSTMGMNWRWRMLPGEFRDDIIGRFRWLTDTFQRILPPPAPEEEEETAEENAGELPETENVTADAGDGQK